MGKRDSIPKRQGLEVAGLLHRDLSDVRTVRVYTAESSLRTIVMSKRINVILPDTTVKVLDRVARKGNRSQFISRAVLHYVESQGKQNLREQLEIGYRANAAENLKVAMEWFPLEEEAWRKSHTVHRGKK